MSPLPMRQSQLLGSRPRAPVAAASLCPPAFFLFEFPSFAAFRPALRLLPPPSVPLHTRPFSSTSPSFFFPFSSSFPFPSSFSFSFAASLIALSAPFPSRLCHSLLYRSFSLRPLFQPNAFFSFLRHLPFFPSFLYSFPPLSYSRFLPTLTTEKKVEDRQTQNAAHGTSARKTTLSLPLRASEGPSANLRPRAGVGQLRLGEDVQRRRVIE